MNPRSGSRPFSSAGCGLLVFLLGFGVLGCGPAASPLDEPMGYKTTSALKERLLEVAKYGDGGSSLGGIPESIEQLTKDDPATGKQLLADFQKLNTATSKDDRKRIAQEMADRLKP